MVPNAFTVGNTQSYERAFNTQERVLKLGPCPTDDPPYDGGAAFKTREEAQAFIDRHGHPYTVYGLILPNGWDSDVSKEPHPSDGVHRVLLDVQAVRL